MDTTVSAIIVCHNSEAVLPHCIAALRQQTHELAQIILVDSGSDDPQYLNQYQHIQNAIIIHTENIGFAKANNLGFSRLQQDTDFVCVLNPDTFLTTEFVRQAVDIMKAEPQAGLIGGKLIWFDLTQQKQTTILDSTGIFRKWYGRWYDRGQGQEDHGQFDHSGEVPAICGAAMFCRYSALLENGPCNIFHPDFFLFKEDIELCFRLKKKGWHIIYLHNLLAYHCRGWHKKRKKMPLFLRRTAAESELLLYKKHPSPYMVWAILKYLLVRFVHI
jgi:N-acetylglucosaminyl-diphospho-decaprenol L-rhamnosyltransferase